MCLLILKRVRYVTADGVNAHVDNTEWPPSLVLLFKDHPPWLELSKGSVQKPTKIRFSPGITLLSTTNQTIPCGAPTHKQTRSTVKWGTLLKLGHIRKVGHFEQLPRFGEVGHTIKNGSHLEKCVTFESFFALSKIAHIRKKMILNVTFVKMGHTVKNGSHDK